MSTTAPKAVFLSYASQDAEAARRICDTLRTSGIEVWFDADGGLEHGDEWDAKIRRQIKECVLFIAVISANTQARHEGYFRIEWDLAAERARGIASGVPFILPVVIDDTREPDALVPDRFRAVQWTKLRGGEIPPEVQQRFLKLWSHRTGALRNQTTSAVPSDSLAPGVPGRPRRTLSLWIGAGISLTALVLAAGVMVFREKKSLMPKEAPPRATPTAGTVAAADEIDQLVKQAREIIYDPESGRTEFMLAENFLKRATDLAPASGAAWGASALLQHFFYSRSYDGTETRQRLVRSQTEAEKTLRLDPRNADALLALGLHRQVLREYDRAQDYLERARAADPQNLRVILALSTQLQDRRARVKFLLDATPDVSHPAELFYYAALGYIHLRRFDEAAKACDRAIAAQPFWRSFVMRAHIERLLSADPAKITAWLDKVPELKRDEPRVSLLRSQAAMLERDYTAAARRLTGVALDYFQDNFFSGPKAFLLAPAYELAGQPRAAAEQWQLAERSVREKLETDPATIGWQAMLAVILSGQKRAQEALATAERCAADERLTTDIEAMEFIAEAFLRLGDSQRAFEWLRRLPTTTGWTRVSAATFAIDPRWDQLRAHPEYNELLNLLKRSETGNAALSVPGASAPAPQSVAVLAFANQSDDRANEPFSDGISEELGVVLGKVPGLRVAGWNSTLSFKGKNTPEAEIARTLGVTHIVSGSVLRSGTQVRITARLVNAADGFSLWSDSFLREAKDIFAVQDEIAGLIAENLKLKLGVDSRRARVVNPEAHRLVLEGRHFWNQRNDDGFVRGEAAFLQAIEIDPTFPEAHAGLAGVYVVRGTYQALEDSAREVAEDFRRARLAATKAVALGPDLAEAHAVLGYTLFNQGERTAAAHEFEKALKLNPNSAPTVTWSSVMTIVSGRLDASLHSYAKAATLDPLWFINLQMYAEGLYYAARYEEALRIAERAAALRSDTFIPNLGLRAQILFALGRRTDALAMARTIRTHLHLDTRWTADAHAIYVLRQCGEAKEAADYATEALRQLEAKSPMRAQIFAALGQFDEALLTISGTRMTMRRYLFWDPIWDAWRDDPRFHAALVQVGCAEDYKVARETLARLKVESAAKK